MKGNIFKYVILTLIIALGVFIGNYALEKYQTYQVNKAIETEREVQDKNGLYDNVVVDQFEKFGSNTWSIKITNYNTRKIYGDITHVDAICNANGLEDGNLIFIGQKLLLP